MPRGVHLHRAGLTVPPTRTLVPARPVQAVGRQEPAGRGEETGVADHAMVGADRAVLDVPGPAEDLEGAAIPKGCRPWPTRRVAVWLMEGGRRRGSRPAAVPFGVGQDAPRLGKVEQDAVEPVLVDARVDVADLHPVGGSSPSRAVTLSAAWAAKSSRTS